MEANPSAATGLFASLRRMADTCVSAVQNRIELFAVELQEEKSWLITTLLWSAAAVFCGGLAVILVMLAILILVPETARPWILLSFCALFLGLAGWAFANLRRQFEQPPPFSDTLDELKKDLTWLRKK